MDVIYIYTNIYNKLIYNDGDGDDNGDSTCAFSIPYLQGSKLLLSQDMIAVII